MDKKEMLENVIWGMDDSDFVEMWNGQFSSFDDDRIYYMEELDSFFCGMSPSEIIASIENNEFSTYDDYFMQDFYSLGYYSFSDPFSEVSLEELLDHIIDNDDDMGVFAIRELLDSSEFALAV